MILIIRKKNDESKNISFYFLKGRVVSSRPPGRRSGRRQRPCVIVSGDGGGNRGAVPSVYPSVSLYQLPSFSFVLPSPFLRTARTFHFYRVRVMLQGDPRLRRGKESKGQEVEETENSLQTGRWKTKGGGRDTKRMVTRRERRKEKIVSTNIARMSHRAVHV